MKNKATATKSIAVLLCAITMTVSLNIYWSYEDLSISQTSTRDSIIYIAAAKSLIKNSNIPMKDPKSPLIEIEEINKNESAVSPNKENVKQKIFANMFILLLSFICLASLHNFILSIETDKKYNAKILLNPAVNKTSDINSTSSSIFKEGVR